MIFTSCPIHGWKKNQYSKWKERTKTYLVPRNHRVRRVSNPSNSFKQFFRFSAEVEPNFWFKERTKTYLVPRNHRVRRVSNPSNSFKQFFRFSAEVEPNLKKQGESSFSLWRDGVLFKWCWTKSCHNKWTILCKPSASITWDYGNRVL